MENKQEEISELLDHGKTLRAVILAQEAARQGDRGPGIALLQYLDKVVMKRAEAHQAVPHDTYKCPHSH